MAKLSRAGRARLSTSASTRPTTPSWSSPATSRPTRCKKLAEATYGQIPRQPGDQGARAAAGAAASRRAPRRAQGSARRQADLAPLLPRAELRHRRAGRGRGARPADEDRRRTAPPAASTRSSSSRRRSPRAPAAGTRAPASTAARSASTRCRPRASLDKVESRDRCGARRGASENGVTAERARARQEGLHRRVHLRERQPGVARAPLRLGR